MVWYKPTTWGQAGRKARERAAFNSAYEAAYRDAHKRVRARYEAADNRVENRNHWRNADCLSASAANDPEVRATLRERARYERDNGCYCKGIVEKLAKDLVRTGPRLQLMTESQDGNRRVEAEFAAWGEEVDLAGKLTTMHRHRVVDGEGFLLFSTNPKLTGPVKLDLRGIECDQISDGWIPQYSNDPNRVDGVTFDQWGNPDTYSVLPYHPGDNGYLMGQGKPKQVPAAQVLHWFRVERYGQVRGVPDLTPALNYFGQLRRYVLAVLMAAEVSAEMCVFLESNLPAGQEVNAQPFEYLDLVRGMITTMPSGIKANAFRPEQPHTGFGDFVDKMLREISAALEMPFGIAANDFSGSSYAGGRLDVQSYHNKIKCERRDLERILNRIFAAWFEEAFFVIPGLADGLPPSRLFVKRWGFDGFPHVDPLKEAQALEINLRNFAATLDDHWAASGEDVYDKLKKIAALKKSMEEAGFTYPGSAPAVTSQQQTETDPEEVPADAAA